MGMSGAPKNGMRILLEVEGEWEIGYWDRSIWIFPMWTVKSQPTDWCFLPRTSSQVEKGDVPK